MDDPQNLDDDDLVRRVIRDDREAFTVLVHRHHAAVFRLVHGIVGDWQIAEDVSQEVFVKVYVKLPGFEFRSKFSTWLYRVSWNAALKARKRSAKWRDLSVLEDGSPGTETEDSSPERVEGEDLMSKLLRPLPAHLRAVVLLREKEGLSYREIADVLDCSVGAVEQRLFRAFERLRKIWRGRPEELGVEE